MAKKTAPKSDERNIVGPDQVDIQDIENQIILIWEQNKGLILGGIAFVFAAFIGFQGFKFLQHRAEVSLQEGYLEATTTEAKASWAQDEASSPLGGFAFKELGDEAYAAGEYSKAASHYEAAIASTLSPIKDAAQIGLAMALVQQGKRGEARSLLSTLADDPDSLNRGEAQYRLALIASEDGDTATARSYIESISEQDFFWRSRAQTLERTLPDA